MINMFDFSEIVQNFSLENGYPEVSFDEISFYKRMVIPREQLLVVAKTLRDKFYFDELIDTVSIDRFTEQNRFELIYNIWSNKHKTRLFIRVKLDSKKPEID